MLTHRRKKLIVFGSIFGAITILLLWAYVPSLMGGTPWLSFKWEGAVASNLNFRDTGASINSCLGAKKLPEGVLLRASGFFSGWSCDKVGNPDLIETLDHGAKHSERYYCRSSNGPLIGEFFNTEEMSDLEFLRTWDEHPDYVKATCQALENGLNALRQGKKVLYHCDAGRDRTGAVSALIAAYLLEEKTPLDDATIAAIECDYRKSRSLSPEKYGRISDLLKTLRSQGGVRAFLHSKCEW